MDLDETIAAVEHVVAFRSAHRLLDGRPRHGMHPPNVISCCRLLDGLTAKAGLKVAHTMRLDTLMKRSGLIIARNQLIRRSMIERLVHVPAVLDQSLAVRSSISR
jgi:hypothetical protein